MTPIEFIHWLKGFTSTSNYLTEEDQEILIDTLKNIDLSELKDPQPSIWPPINRDSDPSELGQNSPTFTVTTTKDKLTLHD